MRYISHLDVLRSWERSLRRAGLPLSYSQGFTPHPKLAFAGPLPLGFVSDSELVDVTLDERVDTAEFRERLAAETTEDLAVLAVEEVPLSSPQPQAALLWADYRVDLPDVGFESAVDAVRTFLERETLEWTEERREKNRTYDLRKAVASLDAAPAGGGTRLSMRLQADQQLTARPEQVIAALFPGVEPGVYCRTGLILDEPSPAREAWRRYGRFAE